MNENLVPLHWEDVRDDFHRLNKEFATLIDDLDPPKSLRLYKARYCYGSEYLKYGKLHLPGPGNELIPLTSPEVPKQVYDDLSYNYGSNPVSFILDKTLELYMSYNYRTTPVAFLQIHPGNIFSTSGIVKSTVKKHHAAFIWNICAGSRTIFMLPKISKEKNYRQLRRTYGSSINAPNNMYEHWHLFKTLYDHNLLGNWHCETIFFSHNWFKDIDSLKYEKLKLYLEKDIYSKLSFWSTQQFWNSYFSMLNNLGKLKPDSYVYDTVRHLLLLSIGALPGIAPATDNSAAPVDAIQKLFINDYKLEKYLPIVMGLKYFDLYKKCEPIYYSLNYANANELSARSNDHSSTISELYETKYLLNYYLRMINQNEYNVSDTVISDIPNLVDFEFFHNSPNNYRDIQHSDLIFKNDSLMSSIPDIKANKVIEHPYSAPFVSGCVKISNKS